MGGGTEGRGEKKGREREREIENKHNESWIKHKKLGAEPCFGVIVQVISAELSLEEAGWLKSTKKIGQYPRDWSAANSSRCQEWPKNCGEIPRAP